MEILAQHIDPQTASAFYRILIGSSTRYIKVTPHLLDLETLRNPSSLLSSLPPLPDGSWEVAHIVPDSPHAIKAIKAADSLPTIQNAWHATRYPFSTLRVLELFTPRTLAVAHPATGGGMVLKHARWDWELPSIDHEAKVYRLLDGTGITPSFLGFLTEGARVNGFLTRRVRGRMPAEGCVEDWMCCRQVLSRLHDLGLKHGAVRREEFILTEDGTVMVDFERCCKAGGEEREREMAEARRMILGE